MMQARRGVTELAHWYNEDHRHSAIRFVTRRNAMRSAMRRCCKHALHVYEKARKKQPQRWSRKTRNRAIIDTVHRNPDSAQTKAAEAALNAA